MSLDRPPSTTGPTAPSRRGCLLFAPDEAMAKLVAIPATAAARPGACRLRRIEGSTDLSCGGWGVHLWLTTPGGSLTLPEQDAWPIGRMPCDHPSAIPTLAAALVAAGHERRTDDLGGQDCPTADRALGAFARDLVEALAVEDPAALDAVVGDDGRPGRALVLEIGVDDDGRPVAMAECDASLTGDWCDLPVSGTLSDRFVASTPVLLRDEESDVEVEGEPVDLSLHALVNDESGLRFTETRPSAIEMLRLIAAKSAGGDASPSDGEEN